MVNENQLSIYNRVLVLTVDTITLALKTWRIALGIVLEIYPGELDEKTKQVSDFNVQGNTTFLK